MRRLVTLDDVRDARTLADVLLAHEVDTEVREEDPAAIEVWVRDDAVLDKAREVAEAWRVDGGRFAEDAARGAQARRSKDQAEARWRARVERTRLSLHGARARPVVTLLVAAAAVVVSLASGLGANRGMSDLFVLTRYQAAADLPELRNGEVWRLVTPALLHFGVLHLLFNLSLWWSFARMVEERKGARFFVPFVLVADAAGFLGQWGLARLFDPRGFAYAGGLSGVLYALVGYIWLKGRLDPTDQLDLPPQQWRFLMGWLLIGFLGILPMANGAHVFGLITGLVWALGDVGLYRLRRRMDGPP